MRNVIVPAMLALAFASISSDASALGPLSKLFNRGNACCDVEPACGCEVAAPVCGCEVVDPCCSAPKCGLLSKLFKKHSCGGCDMGCGCAVAEPACGCEIAAPSCGGCSIEPACGCEIAAPSCGCEVDPCCGPKHKLGGFLKKLFHRHNACCDSGCGCEVLEPACGCEVAAPSCGCGS